MAQVKQCITVKLQGDVSHSDHQAVIHHSRLDVQCCVFLTGTYKATEWCKSKHGYLLCRFSELKLESTSCHLLISGSKVEGTSLIVVVMFIAMLSHVSTWWSLAFSKSPPTLCTRCCWKSTCWYFKCLGQERLCFLSSVEGVVWKCCHLVSLDRLTPSGNIPG